MAALDVGWLWSASDSDTFTVQLADAVQALGCSGLPLAQAGRSGGVAVEDGLSVRVLSWQRQDDCLQARLAVFFRAALARGCACADDDSPAIELVPEYAELCLTLSQQTASSRLVLC